MEVAILFLGRTLPERKSRERLDLDPTIEDTGFNSRIISPKIGCLGAVNAVPFFIGQTGLEQEVIMRGK